MAVPDHDLAVPLEHHRRHLERPAAAVELDVEAEAVAGVVGCEPPRLHRLHDLEAQGAGLQVPAVVAELAAGAQVVLLPVVPADREPVHVAGVRVDAEAGEHEHVARPVVHLEDEPLGPARVVEEDAIVRLEGLVGEQIVELGQHPAAIIHQTPAG